MSSGSHNLSLPPITEQRQLPSLSLSLVVDGDELLQGLQRVDDEDLEEK